MIVYQYLATPAGGVWSFSEGRGDPSVLILVLGGTTPYSKGTQSTTLKRMVWELLFTSKTSFLAIGR